MKSLGPGRPAKGSSAGSSGDKRVEGHGENKAMARVPKIISSAALTRRGLHKLRYLEDVHASKRELELMGMEAKGRGKVHTQILMYAYILCIFNRIEKMVGLNGKNCIQKYRPLMSISSTIAIITFPSIAAPFALLSTPLHKGKT